MTSQRITAKDIESGQIRFPAPAKRAFPREATDIEVELRGIPVSGRWNPRTGPDRERSGVLRVGRQVLEAHVHADEVLTIVERAGRVVLS
ncbi:MAG: hypothetical protein ACLP8S_30780 [Solirubrobacteraceae bacterium]